MKMKYTSLFLKYALVVLLLLIVLATGIVAAATIFIGLLGLTLEHNMHFLVFIPIGLLSAFIAVVAFDCAVHFIDIWAL